MGTDYFELRKPITHLGIEKIGGHCRISIWINHGFSGLLITTKDELDDTIDLFTSEKVIYHGYYGSSQKEEIIEKIHETNNFIVISEHGNIIEAEKLEKKINARY